MGDRLLAVWQGSDKYLFTSSDEPSNNGNVFSSVNFVDIEGVWTYVYFSYSSDEKKAVGFVKYADAQPLMITLDV